MKNWWIRFGCFLTGYNYEIVNDCSQVTVKTVKQYLSAMLIIATFWGFIGYSFTIRYLHGEVWSSCIGALVMIFIIVQVERIIILISGKNKESNNAFLRLLSSPGFYRFILACLMAVIGSIIIDQILFKNDIELAKIEDIGIKVNEYLPIKTKEINDQIGQINEEISKKEKEKDLLNKDIAKRPFISTASTDIRKEKDSTGRMQVVGNEIHKQSQINPNINRVTQIDDQIDKMREQKIAKENKKLTIQEDLEKQFKSETGLLDELKCFFKMMKSSWITKCVWTIFFLFFLMIELLILTIKWTTENDDYNETIIRQMKTRIQKLKNLDS